MSARRLLILCYFYPPLAGGGVHRVLGFTRYLPDHGWDCTVVCAGTEDYWVTDESLLSRVRPGTEVVRVTGGSALSAWLRLRRGDRGRRPGRLFSQLRSLSDWWLLPDSYAGWAQRARRRAVQLLNSRYSPGGGEDSAAERGAPMTAGRSASGFDAVLTSSPPDSVHLAGLALRRRFGLPWVADFRDPWAGLHLREPRTRWHRARQAGLERGVLAGANLVLAASATHAAMLEGRSRSLDPAMRRIVHLPNGYESAPMDPPSAGGEAESAAGPLDERGMFTLIFTGTLSLMPDTMVFLDALNDFFIRRPEARRRLRVKLAGPFDSDYADRAVALGLKGIVEFLGPRSHSSSRTLQRGADLLLLWKPRDCPTMVPGKLYEYLDAGRPMLAVLETDDEAAVLVRRAGGVVVPPGDGASLAAAIEVRYAAWLDGARSASARPAWVADYTRERLAGRLALLLDELAGART